VKRQNKSDFLKALPDRKSLGEHVFDNLRKAIIRGELPSGKRIVESRIAASMNISRTPVREAIHKLEREGLLNKLPKGGFVVLGITRESIEETFGIRSVLESYAARLAAVQHQKGDLTALERKIDEFQDYLQQNRLKALPRINTEFHDCLYALSRSPRLIKMINELRDPIYRFRRIILLDKSLAKRSNADHQQMVRQIRKRDADSVEKLVKEHILRGQTAVMEAMD
jgi:DNA-binding GntR family transcriptional regulator